MLDLWWWHSTADPDITRHWRLAHQHWLKSPIADPERQLSHLFRRTLLASYLDLSPEQLIFAVSDKGKPALVNAPLHFNVSHSEGWHLLLVSDAPCGVDIEPWDRVLDRVRQPAALKRFAERDWLANAGERTFLQCWTMKEALAKYHGQSLWDVLSTPLVRAEDGWRAPGQLSSGQLDLGACAAWVAAPEQTPSIKAFTPALP